MNELERFGQRIADLEEKLETLMRTGIGLGHSSFDDGRINQYTGGLLGGSFGTQYDGSNGAVALSGPVPPTPRWTDNWGPMAEGVLGGLRVRWEGFFEGGDLVVAPLDFSHVEVHVSKQATLDGIVFDTLKTTINSARGGEVLMPMPVDPDGYYIRLTARTVAGKRSIPSTVLGPFYPQKIREEDLGFNLDDFGGTTVFYGSAAPTGPKQLGDLWLHELVTNGDITYETYRWAPVGGGQDWVLLADQGAADALSQAIIAKQAADTKAKIFTQDDAPTGLGATEKAVWFESDAGNRPWAWTGSGWADMRLGNGAIKPNSLVASDVVATGSVTAALLEAILVLATTIISGDPSGTHTKITPQGIFVYQDDPVDGVPNEVIRMGTSSNDYFGITDENGMLILSLDDTGAVNGRTANFREEITVAGRKLSSIITDSTQHFYGYHTSGGFLGVTTEIGLVEVAVDPIPNHMYLIIPEVKWARYGTTTRLILRVREAAPGETLSVASPQVYERPFANVHNDGEHAVAGSPALWAWSTPGTRRLLLTATADRPQPGGIDIFNDIPPSIVLLDLGPRKPITASVNRGGGTTAQPLRQYDTGEMAPADWVAWRGNGTIRDDGVAGPVQGVDPSGFNGNGRGHVNWNLPSITGTVDRVDVYVYFDHWYQNSGGTVIINGRGNLEHGPTYTKFKNDAFYSGMPKPGGRWITLPADWFPHFKDGGFNGVRFDGITIGPAPDSNTVYYGRMNGWASRLRIWYTQ